MHEATHGGYDEGYQRCRCFWGTEPGSFVKLLTRYEPSLEGRKAFDAGCGEGKNAVFLAEIGATVDAIDLSAAAITNGQRIWRKTPNVRWAVADIRYLRLPCSYDVVVTYGLLHCLADRSEVMAVISSFQAASVAGGYHVLCAFNSRRQELDEAHRGFYPCLLNHRDYVSAYSTWAVLAESDSDIVERHPHNDIEHTHSLTRLLARKIS